MTRALALEVDIYWGEGEVMRNDWKKTEAMIVSSTTYRGTGYVPIDSVDFAYKVDGSYYYGRFTTFGSYRKGQILPLYYDPGNPEHNNYWRRERLFKLFCVVFFTLLGLFAVYRFLHPNAK